MQSQANAEQSADGTASGSACAVVIGVLIGFRRGQPLVAYRDNPNDCGAVAATTCSLDESHVGGEVAVLFVDGQASQPLIVGPVRRAVPCVTPAAPPETSVALGESFEATVDGERLVLNAQRDVEIRCGDASVTLTRSGKILLKGQYISSRSAGANKLKGGRVEIN